MVDRSLSRALLKHGKTRRPAFYHLEDPETRYLLVTSADAKGVARDLLVNDFEEPSDKNAFPTTLKSTLKSSPEGMAMPSMETIPMASSGTTIS